MISLLRKLTEREPEPAPDPYGIEAALAERKRLRMAGYVRPHRRRG